MRWIALQWQLEAKPAEPGEAPPPEVTLPTREALGWWALQFTPRVVWLDEALMLEVSACERLWGGPRGLLAAMMSRDPAPDARLLRAEGDSSVTALARLRLMAAGRRPPAGVPGSLPLRTLSAARPHLDMLERLGCLNWGDVEKLPRAGVARRFGTPLREALDIAWLRRPEVFAWLELPEHFELKIELPALAEKAPELLWSAGRLLRSLQIWLRARHRGVLALELQWTLDLKRIDGVDLPPFQEVLLRTAEPLQDMAHIQRLMGEKLALQKMLAPASWLSLRSLETAPWGGASLGFLPEDTRKGDALHELVERLSARLGEGSVLAAVPQADHRPDGMQQWLPARSHLRSLLGKAPAPARARVSPDSVYPGWLLPDPLRLETRQGQPVWRGLLRLVAGPQRLETGWWTSPDGAAPQRAVRDYFIAESPGAGLVWVFQELWRKRDLVSGADSRTEAEVGLAGGDWYLHGLYA